MIHHGDLFDVLPTLGPASVDACVTDPPYGIGFMGKKWDSFLPSTAAKKAGLRQYSTLPRWKENNPNLKGRSVNGVISASQIEYDRTLEGQRAFQDWTSRWAAEVFRVLKPGAHIVVCGAPRSFHRMTCGLEDAGFEIRDCLSWLYGSGFPKSLNVGCRCKHGERSVCSVPSNLPGFSEDVAAGEESNVLTDLQREIAVAADAFNTPLSDAEGNDAASGRPEGGGKLRVEGRRDVQAEQGELHRPEVCPLPAGVSGDGADGRLRNGTPAGSGEAAGPLPTADGGGSPSGSQHAEQRRPQSATVSEQQRAQARGSICETCGGVIGWEGWGTALKPSWEPCVLGRKPFKGNLVGNLSKHGTGALNIDACRIEGLKPEMRAIDSDARNNPILHTKSATGTGEMSDVGRWPANVVLDIEAAAQLDDQVEGLDVDYGSRRQSLVGVRSGAAGRESCVRDAGHGACDVSSLSGASRFYYVAKPSREERDYGCHGLPEKSGGERSGCVDGSAGIGPRSGAQGSARNIHPTVKPVELMRWLVKLVTPINGVVLDPFTGSGTTGMACRYEQRQFIGVEREADYIAIAERRIAAVAPLFGETA